MNSDKSPKSYDYEQRRGVRILSWEDFDTLSRTLVEKLAGYGVEAVVGIARAGLFPATAAACRLRCDLYPARITRRENDRVTHKTPVWKTPISIDVAGKVVAVVDEIADTGETLRLAAAEARRLLARRVVTACLVSHTWADPMPDEVALVSDELVVFPWDRQVWLDGRWQAHPELVEALRLQGVDPGLLDENRRKSP